MMRGRKWIGASHLRGGSRTRWRRSASSSLRYLPGGLHLQDLPKTQPPRRSLSTKTRSKTPSQWPAAYVPPQPKTWRAPRSPHPQSQASDQTPPPTEILRKLSSRARKAKSLSRSCTRRNPGAPRAANPPAQSSARRQPNLLRRRQRPKRSGRNQQASDLMPSSALTPSSSTW